MINTNMLKKNNINKQCCLIISTVPNIKYANYIAKKLLKNKISSCVQFVPINALFYWENTLKEKKEIQIIVKTFLYLKIKVFNEIKKYHPYNIPEILLIKINKINKSYFFWMNNILENKN